MTKQEILNSAPEGATHVDNKHQYWKKLDGYKSEFFHQRSLKWVATSNCNLTQSLADIKRIAELEKGILDTVTMPKEAYDLIIKQYKEMEHKLYSKPIKM